VAEITLKASIRDYKGRSASNQARRSGRVPGVFYFQNKKNIPIEVVALDLRPLVYTSESHIVSLELSDGTKEQCVLREIQFDPVTDKIMHIDLVGLTMGAKMKFEVPVALEGIPAGVRDGGVLQHIQHKLDVECLPGQLPEHITVDVSNLRGGDSITVGQLSIPNATILNDPEQVVALVSHSRVDPTTEEAGEDTTEPEVIVRGKDAGEEG
jgi:large subunit ribosomal protein L25